MTPNPQITPYNTLESQPQSQPAPGPGPGPVPMSWKTFYRRPLRPATAIPTIAALILVTWILISTYDLGDRIGNLECLPENGARGGGGRLHARDAPPDQEEQECDPFRSFGYIRNNLIHPESNVWIPLDPSCPPSKFMEAVRSTLPYRPELRDLPINQSDPNHFSFHRTPLPSPPVALSWLRHRTIALVGDSIERFHIADFCNLAGGELNVIGPDHHLSPRPFKNGKDETFWNGSDEERVSRPVICHVDRYDLVLVSIFHYGLKERDEFEMVDWLQRHYYPPIETTDRIDHILVSIFRELGREPDLVEFSSGFWDLGHWSVADRSRGQSVHLDLSTERINWYEKRLRHTLLHLGRTFPRSTILFRALHHIGAWQAVPMNHVPVLDHVSRKVVRELAEGDDLGNGRGKRVRKGGREGKGKREGKVGGRGGRKPGDVGVERGTGSFRGSWENTFRRKQSSTVVGNVTRPTVAGSKKGVLGGRIRTNEWGSIMGGQEIFFRDNLHPNVLPGDYIWSDVLLFELRKAVLEREDVQYLYKN